MVLDSFLFKSKNTRMMSTDYFQGFIKINMTLSEAKMKKKKRNNLEIMF